MQQEFGYDEHQFIWEVINEAVALRQHATRAELASLDFGSFDPMWPSSCIYGQATGTCFGKRASQLISLCCPRYFHSGAIIRDNTLNTIVRNVNGTEVPNLEQIRANGRKFFSNTTMYYSAIEAYIVMRGAKNKNLIAYLRGETEELDIYI